MQKLLIRIGVRWYGSSSPDMEKLPQGGMAEQNLETSPKANSDIGRLCLQSPCLNCRAVNSGGTWEPSSEKQFDFAESLYSFKILKHLNSSEFSVKIIFLA